MNIDIIYDGAYPNLCRGKLVVVIDGDVWNFPEYCMDPGGIVDFTDEWDEIVETGPWSISSWPHLFPEELKDDVVDAVNSQVDWGNCGGCV